MPERSTQLHERGENPKQFGWLREAERNRLTVSIRPAGRTCFIVWNLVLYLSLSVCLLFSVCSSCIHVCVCVRGVRVGRGKDEEDSCLAAFLRFFFFFFFYFLQLDVIKSTWTLQEFSQKGYATKINTISLFTDTQLSSHVRTQNIFFMTFIIPALRTGVCVCARACACEVSSLFQDIHMVLHSAC